MEEDTEYLKLPVDEMCQHKLWKARLKGYELALKLFQEIVDEKSPEWNKYLGLVKKFVVDSNVPAQEKGLEAVLAFVENAGCAGKTSGEVVSGLVSKCFASPKVKTKEKAAEIIMMYIEIEKFEIVQDELIKGLSAKTPKVVVACVQSLRESLRDFGPKVITIKPIVKQLPTLLEDRDKSVRDEAKLLTVEVYRWIGSAFKSQLANLKPVQVTELEAEFAKLGNEKPVPTRYIRSQQALRAKLVQQTSQADDQDEEEDEADAAVEIDPYELLQPVNILAQLPKDFYEKCEAKKWQERKEAVDAIAPLTSNPKLEPGDYGDLVRAIKKIISKDTNVMIVAVAGKCLAGLANGLKKKFQPYVGQCFPAVLEKFKEKKQNVVQAMREAVDAMFPCTTLDAIQEDLLTFLDNKNPTIKAETAGFMARAFSKCDATVLTKKHLKTYCPGLLKALNDPDPIVRDSAADALGTAMKLLGERVIGPFIQDVDNVKMAKIKEFCEKAVVAVPKAEKKKKPSSKPEPKSSDSSASDPVQPLPAKNVEVAPIKKKAAVVKKPATEVKKGTTKTKVVKKGVNASNASEAPMEKELSQEEVDERLAEILTPETLTGLSDANWKTRLSSVEQLMQAVRNSEPDMYLTQAFVRLLVTKPGLKETNFQVLKLKLEVLAYLASNSKFTKRSALFVIDDLAEKIGDAKNGSGASDALTAIAEATKLDYIATQALDYVFSQKNPKNQVEAMNWLTNSIKDFGLTIQVKPVIDNVKKALAATNPAVRTSAITLLGIMYTYMGSNLRVLFENEKSSLLQQIDAEFEKLQGVVPPPPTKGIPIRTQNKGEEMDDGDASESQQVNIADLVPRTDISAQISQSLLNELGDKNWKVRLEALQKLGNIINEVKFITSNLGDLPMVFKSRLLDSNKNLAIQAINICQAIGTGMGPSCNKYVRIFAAALFTCLGDGKANVRSAALACLKAWVEQCGFVPFLESEILPDALKLDNPNLRIELLGWLTELLPGYKSLPTGDLLQCLPYLYSSLEDRSQDVRKKAQDVVLPFMIHLGYEQMSRAASKLKPASKTQIVACLDKAKPNLPVKQAPAKSAISSATMVKKPKSAGASAPSVGDNYLNGAKTDSNGAESNKGKTIRPPSQGRTIGKGPVGVGKKKDEECDASPTMIANNLKEQRIYDEQKLKVLKWNFTAPRDEFYELLQEQMTVAGFNKGLLNHLFHNDFKFHLKAIDTFVECLENLPEASIANLDLILKWIALRFFDTNPSVLLKGLEYLQALFHRLASISYHLHEYEAASFIPYLILKVGDPKDPVRQGVRSIFKLMYKVFPANKIFLYILDGLKSKNARQRTECLEELGFLIETYGMNVCMPNSQMALKEIAKQISDRDNSVRNAALNCVVQAYALDGDKVYKYVGPISDKDMGLLEERIKRTCKPRPGFVPPSLMPVVPPPKAPSPETKAKTPPPRTSPIVNDQTITHQRISATITRPSRPVSGVFSLDFEKMDLSVENYELEMPKLFKHNIDELLSEPVKFPETILRPPSPTSVMVNNSRDAVAAVDAAINQAGSNDILISVQSLVQIDELLKLEDRAIVMISRVDFFLMTVVRQYKKALGMTYTKRLTDERDDSCDVFSLYRNLTMTLVSLFSHSTLAKKASKDVLRDLIYHLITVLTDSRLPELKDGPPLIRSINVLIIKIEERAEPTNVLCALIKLLHECVANDNTSDKFTELVMKCIWKFVNLLPGKINDMNLDKVLLDLHIFLKAFPSPHWKEKLRDIPLRTVKTVLHSLAKQKGNKILNHLSLINDPQESELENYLKKVLKGGVRHRSSRSTNLDDQNRGVGGTDQGTFKREHRHSPRRLSKTTHEMLAEIFKKIGAKETTKEGLSDLHRFKKSYPEADIAPFLSKSSANFQSYIERGLKSIELEFGNRAMSPNSSLLRQSALSISTGSIPSAISPKASSASSGINANISPSVYRERLKLLRARCGYDDPVGEDTKVTRTSHGILAKAVSISGELECQSRLEDNATVIRQQQKESVIIQSVIHSNSSESLSQFTTGGSVEDLRRRLERIKSSKN